MSSNFGALSGIKVIDITSMVSGPVAAMMLADQGADVIKVEPLQGEQMRHIGPAQNDVAAGFFSCNRAKKSIALDLKSDEGKEILHRLAGDADIFMQNFRPGAIDRMGFSDTVLRKNNEKLIYLSISGFGEKGPYADSRVYDPVIQALSGATDIQEDRATGRPQMFRVIIADKVTSLTAAQALSSALYAREISGKGQHIRLSMLDAMLAFFWPEAMAGLTYAENEFDAKKFQGVMDLIYETQDRYITAGAVSDKEWAGMCRALDKEEWIEDTRFADSTARFVNSMERKQLTAAEIAKFSSEEVLERLKAEDVPCAPLLNRMELMDHEQIKANNTVETHNFPDFGKVRQARPAARFSDTPSQISAPGPRIGEHTRDILESLGYSNSDINELVAGKKVRVDD